MALPSDKYASLLRVLSAPQEETAVIHKVAFVMSLLLIVVLSVSTPGAGKKKSGKGKKKAQGIPMAIADLQEKIDDLQD